MSVITETAHPIDTAHGAALSANPEADQLHARIRELENELHTTAGAFAAFKALVVTRGEEAAREHGWCSVYDNILDDLGLQRPARRVRGTLTLTITFEGTPDDITDGMRECFVRDSLHPAGEMDDWLDDDWTDTRLCVEEITVSDLEQIT